jgi:hypothetical protein
MLLKEDFFWRPKHLDPKSALLHGRGTMLSTLENRRQLSHRFLRQSRIGILGAIC